MYRYFILSFNTVFISLIHFLFSFSFLCHFCFIYLHLFFFAFFFLCASYESIMCFIRMSLFLIYPYSPLNSPRRTPRPSELSGKKLNFLLPLMLCYSRYLTGQFTLFLSALPTLGAANSHPNLVHSFPFLLVPQGDSGREVALSPARFFRCAYF